MQRIYILVMMDEFAEDNLFDELLLDEIDFSSLLDLPSLNDSILLKPKYEPPVGEKYIVFHIDDNLYGINSKRVAEIIGNLTITSLPSVPEWIAGIANWRGDIISVIDLRKLWEKKTKTPKKTRLVIFHANKNDSAIAFVVDKVTEIVTLSVNDINFSAADFTESYPTFFAKADYKSQPLYLLDIDKILTSLNVNDSKLIGV